MISSFKRGWMRISIALWPGVLSTDFSLTRLNVRNASFIPKTLPPNSRSPSSTVKHYLESKQSSILVYISTRNWPVPLTLMLSLLNVLKCLFLSKGSVLWTSTNPSYEELFPTVLFLLFYIAHQSFPLDCLIKTLPLLKNGYVCYQLPAVFLTHIFVKFF